MGVIAEMIREDIIEDVTKDILTDVARSMLNDDMELEIIAKHTGLTESSILKLKDELEKE